MAHDHYTSIGEDGQPQRLTELLMAMSLAADLGTGQPAGHTLRSAYIGVRLSEALGCQEDERRSVLQLLLLCYLGCTADSVEAARVGGGDDRRFIAAMSPAVMGSTREIVSTLVRYAGFGQPRLARLRTLTGALMNPNGMADSLSMHCEVAAMLGQRLTLGGDVNRALSHAFERWDGKGFPSGLRGEAIPLAVRIAAVAQDADTFVQLGEDPAEPLRTRAGRSYDPRVVDAFLRDGEQILEEFNRTDGWNALLACEPRPPVVIPASSRTHVLSVFADFVDLKSPWTRGHSRNVAELAASAGKELGLAEDEQVLLKQAGLVHDIGRVGVANGIWDKPGPLTTEEWERVRLHPYFTHRILSRCEALFQLAEIAASHHERLDGSGYHRGHRAEQLSMPARILAAADVFSAVCADRPHRPAMNQSEAAALLEREAHAGRLDPDAGAAVLSAAGMKATKSRPQWPAGLTDREVEVLQLIARGKTNRQVAHHLYISPKTVGRHVENIYVKAGVSTRAGVAVFAMEHRLLD